MDLALYLAPQMLQSVEVATDESPPCTPIPCQQAPFLSLNPTLIHIPLNISPSHSRYTSPLLPQHLIIVYPPSNSLLLYIHFTCPNHLKVFVFTLSSTFNPTPYSLRTSTFILLSLHVISRAPLK